MIADSTPAEQVARLEDVLRGIDDPEAAIARLPDELRALASRVHNGTQSADEMDAETARWLTRATAILARRMAGPPEGDLP